jgi:ribose 5-phosphate isomerase B
MKLAIGADHGGYLLKEEIKVYLTARGIEFEDFGTFSEASVDYPQIAAKVAHAVANGTYERGLLFCGTGIGISIAANKVKGIRAAVCADEFSAEFCRRHNNANIFCLGGRVVTTEQAKKLVGIYLDTPFEGDRHLRRVSQITDIENGVL